MSELQTLRALVIKRLAPEISALVERTITECVEELCRSEEENHRRQQLLDQALSPSVLLNQGLNQDFTQTPRIKEEPEEHGVSAEEEHLPEPVPESSAVCVKREESRSEQLMETEADGDDDNQIQSRDTSNKLSPNNKSAPETTVHNEDKSGSDVAEQKKHLCPFCNKGFGCESALQRHIRVHTGEKPYRCSSCEKTFTQKGHIQEHMRTHTGERPYSCSICEKRFNHKSHIVVHMRTHTGEKPFSCPTCETKFAHRPALKAHLRTHTGEKPFSCPTCEAKFAHHSYLKAHLRIHTGERPYSCQTCEKTFNQRHHLNRHIRTHTGEKPFACLVCDKTFAGKSNLQSHMKTH